MNRCRINRGKKNRSPAVYRVLLMLLSVVMMCILVLCFSTEIGQANGGIPKFVISRISINILKSGSSLIRYEGGRDGKENTLSESLWANVVPLYKYVNDTNGNMDTIKTQPPLNHIVPPEMVYSPNKEIRTNTKEETKDEEWDRKNTEEIDSRKGEKIRFHEITEGKLSKEYILTNGAAFHEEAFEEYVASQGMRGYDSYGQVSVGVVDGALEYKESLEYGSVGEGAAIDTISKNVRINYTLEQLKDIKFLVNNFYIVDPDTKVTEELFDAEELLSKDMTIKQGNEAPQILIYHTHSQEDFIDSRKGKQEDTVVGVGTYLEEILREDYGYSVIHDTSCYDVVGGVGDRNRAYDYAEEGVSKILKENPTIEVVIDLHRDALKKRSTIINGEETAQIMLFNGLSRDLDGPIARLENPNLQDNLAFGFQLQLKANEKYPGLFYKNYLKSYRYNLHLRQKAILIELGTEYNSLASAKNAMAPFAEVLDAVLQGE